MSGLFTSIADVKDFLKEVWDAIRPIVQIIAAIIFIICIVVICYWTGPLGVTFYYWVAGAVVSGIIGFSTLISWLGSAIVFIGEEVIPVISAVIGSVVSSVGSALLSSPLGVALLIGVALYFFGDGKEGYETTSPNRRGSDGNVGAPSTSGAVVG